MNDDNGSVRNPDRDRRVSDADRFLDDRRREALAMLSLWQRSRKSYAADEIRYWTAVLREIDTKAAKVRIRRGDE